MRRTIYFAWIACFLALTWTAGASGANVPGLTRLAKEAKDAADSAQSLAQKAKSDADEAASTTTGAASVGALNEVLTSKRADRRRRPRHETAKVTFTQALQARDVTAAAKDSAKIASDLASANTDLDDDQRQAIFKAAEQAKEVAATAQDAYNEASNALNITESARRLRAER